MGKSKQVARAKTEEQYASVQGDVQSVTHSRLGITKSQRTTSIGFFSRRVTNLFQVFGGIELSLLGIGIYRAWIELMFVKPTFTASYLPDLHDLYDGAMIIALLVCAAFSSRIQVLATKQPILWVTLLSAVCGTLLCTGGYLGFASAPFMYAGVAFSGCATALIILLWSEFFGCLKPLRVGFYYALSFVVGFLAIEATHLLTTTGSVVYVCCLPIASLFLLVQAHKSLSSAERLTVTHTPYRFPVKPVALMALFACAYGFREPIMYELMGPHSSLGLLLLSGGIVFILVAMQSRWNYSVFLGRIVPLIAVVLLVLSNFMPATSSITENLISASYAAFSVFIMTIFANISYRYGVSALWLFGIERGVRALVMMGARKGYYLMTSLVSLHPEYQFLSSFAYSAVILCLLTLFSYLVLSHNASEEDWGVVTSVKTELDPVMREKIRLAQAVDKAVADKGLTKREQEVLELLLARKSISDIENALVIARGTAKAHISHIYTKLSVSSREELFEYFEIKTQTS